MIRAFALIVHPDREDAAACAMRAEAFLRDQKLEVIRPQEGQMIPGKDTVILTFGGDGTLLIGASYAIRFEAPLLGINLGTVGFLTEGEPEQLPELLNNLLAGNYSTEERALLRVRVNQEDEDYYALNDVVVSRGGFARLIRVETYVNDEYLGICTSDGIIASTPTGSTGYSLSAGGPVVDPSVRSIILTPVCPHSLQHAVYVISDQAVLRFHLQDNRKHSAELQIDGQNRASLQAGDTVYVTGAEKTLRLIRFQPCRFFTLTRKKLNEWSLADERGTKP